MQKWLGTMVRTQCVMEHVKIWMGPSLVALDLQLCEKLSASNILINHIYKSR